jgi:YHS domain-containing protein
MKRQHNQRNFVDPVCGMEVSYTTASEEFIYNGKTYYFCARSCREEFQAAPDKFIRQHRQHGVRSD